MSGSTGGGRAIKQMLFVLSSDHVCICLSRFLAVVWHGVSNALDPEAGYIWPTCICYQPKVKLTAYLGTRVEGWHPACASQTKDAFHHFTP